MNSSSNGKDSFQEDIKGGEEELGKTSNESAESQNFYCRWECLF